MWILLRGFSGEWAGGGGWVDGCRGMDGVERERERRRGREEGGKVPLDVFGAGAKVGYVIDFVFEQLS